MTRLLLRDAAQRYGVGVSLTALTSVYLGHSLPPWVVRDWLWSRAPSTAVAALAIAALVYLLVTFPIARLLLASHRLEYWRQFAISPWQWRRLSLSHLVTVNLPILAVMVYMAAPALDAGHAIIAGVMVASGYALLLGLQALAVRHWHPATRLGWMPNVTSPWAAIARLHVLVWWRRQRTAALSSCGVQVAATGLAALGAYHVAELEPAAAWPLLRTLAIVGGFASAWSLARATQALDRERWFLDTLGITAASVLRGRLAAGLAMGSFTILGTGIAGSMLGPLGALHGGYIAMTTVALGAAAACNVVASAEVRRDIQTLRPASIAARAALALLLINVLGEVALLVLTGLEAALALRSIRRATLIRARFETTHREDDHD